jgi:hypothetical protein
MREIPRFPCYSNGSLVMFRLDLSNIGPLSARIDVVKNLNCMIIFGLLKKVKVKKRRRSGQIAYFCLL